MLIALYDNKTYIVNNYNNKYVLITGKIPCQKISFNWLVLIVSCPNSTFHVTGTLGKLVL